MCPTNLKELQPRNRSAHERRIRMLKASVLGHRYRVEPNLIAGGILDEARSGQASGQESRH